MLDVRVAVDVVDDHVADRLVGVVHGHPAASGVCVLGQGFDRIGVVRGDVSQADLAEPKAREPLDLPECRSVVGTRRANVPGAHALLLASPEHGFERGDVVGEARRELDHEHLVAEVGRASCRERV